MAKMIESFVLVFISYEFEHVDNQGKYKLKS